MRGGPVLAPQGDRALTGTAVELERVTYTYPGASGPALRDLTLTVAAGQVVVVVGASGSGKSTLLRIVSGLVPHFHGGTFCGHAAVAGRDIREHGPGELAVDVGTVFQDPETQVVMGTPRAELAFPLENRGSPPAAVARGVEEAALALGVPQLLDRPTGELSGGELQRVALAAALAGRPSVLVLDEPTSQLDPVAAEDLLAVLRRFNEDSDVAVLLAEHRLERCLGLADRVIALARGGIVCDADPAEFLRWAIDNAPELCTPGVTLLARLGLPPAPGVKAARRALSAAGLAPAPASRTPTAPADRPRSGDEPVLRLERVWHEVRQGPSILRSLTLEIRAGERIALMGRNGAGKSTLLRHAAGLMRPTRGRVWAAGRVALLLQNPTDYLVADTVGEEAPAAALRAAGLQPELFAARHPRELSGGERQRLALAIVLAADDQASRPPVVCLDEPTRGMDRGLRAQLAGLLAELPAAVIVATHDPELAAAFAERVVLMADGAVIADGPAGEILARGTYFVTETARILGGAGGALTPEDGARALQHAEWAQVVV